MLTFLKSDTKPAKVRREILCRVHTHTHTHICFHRSQMQAHMCEVNKDRPEESDIWRRDEVYTCFHCLSYSQDLQIEREGKRERESKSERERGRDGASSRVMTQND